MIQAHCPSCNRVTGPESTLSRGPVFFVALLLSGAFYVSAPSRAAADTIELKTGERLEGTLRAATPTLVEVEIAGQVLRIDGKKVRAVYFGAAPLGASTGVSARADALRALRGLRSAAEGSLTYRDYAPRVTDARVLVNRYLDEQPADSPDFRRAVATSMRYYDLAASAWNAKIVGRGGGRPDYAGLVADPAVNACRSLRAALGPVREERGRPRDGDVTEADARDVASLFEVFFLCARGPLAEAENLVPR